MYSQDHLSKWARGQGKFAEVSKEDWNDWVWQLRHRALNAETLGKYVKLTQSEKIGLEQANHKLLFSVTPYFLNLMDAEDADCPVRKQVIPRENELQVAPEERDDPVGEERSTPVPGIVHRYPDRVLFLVTSVCGSYCRYCTRSRLVSNAQGYDFHPNHKKALEYIRSNKNIRDVLLSGGDPLMLPDRKLGKILSELRRIPHIEFIRIGSRIPVFMPQRITDSLCEVLEQNGPIWMSIHVNHPAECTLELREACRKLSKSWVVLGNQSVLLKGVNDSVKVLTSLSHRLLQMGVRPYYLYQCDLIKGSAHFRTKVDTGLEIIKGMRGFTTGYAVPQLVIDAPGGGGKVPISLETIEEMTGDTVRVRNFQNKCYEYPREPRAKSAFKAKRDVKSYGE